MFLRSSFQYLKINLQDKKLWKDFTPFNNCLLQAKKLMFEESIKETDHLISQGCLRGYDVITKDGINRSIHYTTGRFGRETLIKLYDIAELSVLPNTSRLALLIMREAHSRADSTSHRRSPVDIIGRACQFAVIYKPYRLALQVSKSCPCCILEEVKKKPVQQKIRQLNGDCLTPSPPFSDVSADHAGPF